MKDNEKKALERALVLLRLIFSSRSAIDYRADSVTSIALRAIDKAIGIWSSNDEMKTDIILLKGLLKDYD